MADTVVAASIAPSERVAAALEMRDQGADLASIAQEFGVSVTTIHDWCNPDRAWRRTEVPGVFCRSGRFFVRYRREGKSQWSHACDTLQEAVALKSEIACNRQKIQRDLNRRKRQANVRQRADLGDAYSFVRKALQAVERAKLPTGRERAIMSALYEAEDEISTSMRAP